MFVFDNSYARLPPHFFAPVAPTAVAAPRLIHLNVALARSLGLDPDQLSSEEAAVWFSGNRPPAGAAAIAMAYAGHQFGHFVPQLGDGRAILLGEVIDQQGQRRDLQWKGSGITPFSRRGDGRAALGPVLREYLVSEAMTAMGIPSTRSLAAVATGEPVFRERPLPGAVLTRVAKSHIRVGTFQYFAARGDIAAVQTLADYVIARHDPTIEGQDQPYRRLLEAVITRQAHLVAQWLLVGFVHGVMNTDNCSIAGETIDFGPCAFLDHYDRQMVFSSIDQFGRYAYGQQPTIALWNLTRLAESLLPLLAADDVAAIAAAEAALDGFKPQFDAAYHAGLRAKLGLTSAEEGDFSLAQGLLDAMSAQAVDFTLAFRCLCEAADGPEGDRAMQALFTDPTAYDLWATAWRARLRRDAPAPDRAERMRRVNPAVIPRNHQIEAVIQSAVTDADFAPFQAMLAAVTDPYRSRPAEDRWVQPPRPEERVTETFCGT